MKPSVSALLKRNPQLEGRVRAYSDVDAPLPVMREGAPAEDFEQLRAEARQLLGYDFLGTLGDMGRFPEFVSSKRGVAKRSRHKCFDAFDLNQADRQTVVVREVVGAKWFWRIFVKCVKQDGTLGELRELAPFDFVRRKVTEMVKASVVDFTALARKHNFERIPAWDEFTRGGSYTTSEWWHFQNDEGRSFDDVIRSLYAREAGPAGRAIGGQSPAAPLSKLPTLGLNDRGPQVGAVQNALALTGFLPRGDVDNIFGEKTRAAVEKLQSEAGLKADGIFGPLSCSALQSKLAAKG